MKKLFLPSLLIASCLMLTACDNHPYKEELQRIYDYNNPTGNKAVCMIVGDIPYSSYPYTTFHMQKEDLPYESLKSEPPDYYYPYYNRLENENLHFFSQAGLLTEAEAGEDKGKPIYTYDLTDLGREHFSGFRNQTNFCFGRIVVDSFDGTKDGINGVGGGKIRHVYITYHVENIPEWVKTSKAYDLYSYPEEVVTGEKLKGDNYYDVFSDGRVKFKNFGTVVIGYQGATRSDDEDYPFKEELDKKDVEEKEDK